MQFKQTLLSLLIFLLPCLLFSQTTYIPLWSKDNILIDRMEIKAGTDSVLNFSMSRPYSRKQVVPEIGRLDSLLSSPVDRYNYRSLMMNNLEWATGNRDDYASKKPILKHFYQNPANFYQVYTKDFFLAANPVLSLSLGKESIDSKRLFLNTRGVSFRGRIADKIGFSAYMADNQERAPLYIRQYDREHKAVPGMGYYKHYLNTGFDYFDANGYITFNVTRYIDVAFGYDKNFIGNGYRSLFLSDFSSNALFLKLNTRIWKFNYQNLFMELNSAEPRPNDRLLNKKYAAIHHLDMGITKWLNVGLFEAIVFGRPNHIEFTYLNPIIFYRSIEQQNGSFDNALVGIDAKANVAHRFQFYGQFLLDEFNLREIKKHNGWWGNKFGIQGGAKYVDVFGIKNLDLQVEGNIVRPFTYSHRDSVANYTHYNQPLAHPLGANFKELITILRYQPIPKLTVLAKGIFYLQGKDTGGVSYGDNILLPYNPPYRQADYGFYVGSGVKTNTTFASLMLSYEIKQNLFIEANVIRREQTSAVPSLSSSTTIFNAGIRWNIYRRDYDF